MNFNERSNIIVPVLLVVILFSIPSIGFFYHYLYNLRNNNLPVKTVRCDDGITVSIPQPK